MKVPLLIAHGQGLITLVLIGFPAALIGVVCLIVTAVLAAKGKEEDRRTVRQLGIVGICALGIAFLSPFVGRWMGF